MWRIKKKVHRAQMTHLTSFGPVFIVAEFPFQPLPSSPSHALSVAPPVGVGCHKWWKVVYIFIVDLYIIISKVKKKRKKKNTYQGLDTHLKPQLSSSDAGGGHTSSKNIYLEHETCQVSCPWCCCCFGGHQTPHCHHCRFGGGGMCQEGCGHIMMHLWGGSGGHVVMGVTVVVVQAIVVALYITYIIICNKE